MIYVPLCLNQGKNGKDGEPGPAGSDGGPVSGDTNMTGLAIPDNTGKFKRSNFLKYLAIKNCEKTFLRNIREIFKNGLRIHNVFRCHYFKK